MVLLHDEDSRWYSNRVRIDPMGHRANMGNKGNPKRNSRWSGRAVIKAEEKRRRRQEAKDAIREAQMERIEIEEEIVLSRRIPLRYD